MPTPRIIVLLLLLLSTAAQAQKATLYGRLRDSLTFYPIAGGTVTNEQSRKSVTTGTNGIFKIEVAPNDLIHASAPSYRYDTIRFSLMFSDTITIYLTPTGSLLPNVTVQSQYTRYQLDSIRRQTEFEETRETEMNTFSRTNNIGFGVGLNLDRIFKKRDRNKKQYEHKFKSIEEAAYVDYRFSPQLVATYTGLRGETLQLFLYQYRPSHEWLRKHTTNEEVLNYINASLKKFNASSSR